MSTDAQKKNCKQCHQDKLIGQFPVHPTSKDGRLGYCETCWSRKMTKAAQGRKRPTSKKSIPVAKSIPLAKAASVKAANDALQAAGSVQDRFLLRADDGDEAEFASEEKVLKQAIEWRLKGHEVTIWRQCAFEIKLRIIN